MNSRSFLYGHVLAAALLCCAAGRAFAGNGTEASSFLDIPIGGRPAALGAGYSALATDAYAPVWNPAGLGFLDSSQLAAMHLSYLGSLKYEFASVVHPLSDGKSVGASVQYLMSGAIAGTDADGKLLGTFSGHYGAYSVAYGQKLSEKLSLGLTGKMIDAQISDVSGHAYAFDAGTLFQATEHLRLAAVLANVGSKMTFIDQRDSLPTALRFGGLFSPVQSLHLTAEGVHALAGTTNGHFGVEFSPLPYISFRTGYRSDTTKNLSALAGFTTGIGLQFWGQEFDYAWVPLGELGSTQYFSLVLHFGTLKEQSPNLQRHANVRNIEASTLSEEIVGAGHV